MEFQELIAERYSCRAYHSRAIEPEVLQKVIDAFVLAPTAANKQPIGLIVTTIPGNEEKLNKVVPQPWLYKSPAPLMLVVCTTPDKAWVRKYDGKNHADVDASIAMDHAVLAAANEGLGTCWIASFDPDAAKELFALPEGVEPVLITPLGYPADAPRKKLRKPADSLVHYDTW